MSDYPWTRPWDDSGLGAGDLKICWIAGMLEGCDCIGLGASCSVAADGFSVPIWRGMDYILKLHQLLKTAYSIHRPEMR